MARQLQRGSSVTKLSNDVDNVPVDGDIVCRVCGVTHRAGDVHVHRLLQLTGRDVERVRSAVQDMLRAEIAARGARMTLQRLLREIGAVEVDVDEVKL